MPWHSPEVVLKITDILDVSHRGVKVVSKQTGKPLWLPRELDYFPDCVFIPLWLAKKIGVDDGRDNHDDQ